jgi:hypothetical protein
VASISAWKSCAELARGQVERTLPALERIFLSASGLTEQVAEGSEELNAHCERLLALGEGLDTRQHAIHRCQDLLAEPLKYIADCVGQQQRLLEVLQRCDAGTSAMFRVRRDIQRALAPLTFISVMFRIESASLSDEIRETFTNVTSQIDRLRHLADESISSSASLLAERLDSLRSLRDFLQAEFPRLADHLNAKRAQLDRAIGQLGKQLGHNAGRHQNLSAYSACVRRQLAELIKHLQFQDIVQQRCAHVIEALNGPGSEQAPLQALQLRGVISELAQGQAALQAAVDEVNAQSEDLCAGGAGEDFSAMTTATEEVLGLLVTTIREVRTLMSETMQAVERSQGTAVALDGLTKDLASALNELSIDMWIIAHNAEIRAALDGAGTGLEQLSARTAGVANDIAQLSETYAGVLAELSNAGKAMRAATEAVGKQGADRREAFDSASAQAETQLSELKQRTRESYTGLQEVLRRVQSDLSAMSRAVGEIGSQCDDVAGAAEWLEAFARQHRLRRIDENEAAQLTQRYTMATERQVHDAVLEIEHAPIPEASEEVAAGDAKVELF